MKTKIALLSLTALLPAWPGFSAATGSSASGVTEPFLDVRLSVAVPGIVTVKNVKEGDAVKEGDVILELDKQLEEFEVLRRKAVLDNRRSDRDATAVLYKNSKSVSKEELEKKELEFKVASAEYDIAAEQLRRRQLLSPLSGWVTEVHVEKGEAAQPYQPVVRVVDVRRCYFVCPLEAREAAGLKLNQPLKLEIETGAAPVLVEGKVDFLSPVADPASGLTRVKVVFENPEGRIRPGLAGRILFN